MHWRVRLALGLVLAAALGGAFVHYGASYEQQWPYPTQTELGEDYDAHLGQETLVFGTVESNTETGLRIRVDTASGPLSMRVPDARVDVRPGGVVQVYGTVAPDSVLDAENVAVVNGAGDAELYKYAVSAVAALAILVGFFRYWTVDTDAWAFEVRDG